MKVLVATIFAYPPRGGLGAYIKQLKAGLEQNGHEVDILARHKDEYYLTRGSRRYPLRRKSFGKAVARSLPSNWIGTQAWKYSEPLRDESTKFLGAVRKIDLSRYQIIHAQDIVSASVIRQFKPSLTPVVLTVHGCVTAEYYYFGLIKPRSMGWNVISTFESSVLRQTDQVIVPSEWLVGVYKKCGIPTGNMQVIPNGIDIPAFQRKMGQLTGLKSPAGKSIILCTGRLEKVKGQHVLLDALARLKKRRSDWVCWIAGRGATGKALRKQAERLGLGGYVKFLGRRDDIPALLKQADIFVIPSLEENFPYSLVEAQAAGKAIIASRAGGITEMMKDGKNGILVPPGDHRKLAEQVEKLLKQPELQKSLGAEAAAWSKTNFSLEAMMKQVLEVYGHVLQSKSAKRSGK